MIITKDAVVSIHYKLTDDAGLLIDSSEGTAPLEYIHGNGQLIPGLERRLEGRSAGDTFSAVIEPADAYGEYNEKWVQDVPRSQFDDGMDIQEGMQFQADTATGPTIVTVTKVTDDTVTVDANHELAGKRLHFDIEVTDVRSATEDELFQLQNSSCGCGGGCSGCGGACDSCSGCA